MKTIKVVCPKCQTAFQAPVEYGGRNARCRKCHSPVQIPLFSAKYNVQEEPIESLPEPPEPPELPPLPEQPPASPKGADKPWNPEPEALKKDPKPKQKAKLSVESSDRRYPVLILYLRIQEFSAILTAAIAILIYGVTFLIAWQSMGAYEAFVALVSTMILCGLAIFMAIVILAAVQLIRVVIDVEYNTRRTATYAETQINR